MLVHEFMSIYYALAGWSGNRERRDERTKRKREKEKADQEKSQKKPAKVTKSTRSLPMAARAEPTTEAAFKGASARATTMRAHSHISALRFTLPDYYSTGQG
ncbi:hypothetical protein EVAR_94060_1 [Eumeta japonica]|uniref:Uncharacterized protein n=1 Tax=Eumeta variegata TaxID=151549 RepID=A0A4C1V6Z5_EUMVA|nr:hypothetical protein EVAR_94060_1 [Eumeta japonica]